MSIPFSISQLNYIIEVDRLKSFNKAASKCNVSQPTLSMQIQKVEDYYGIQIFKRTKRSVSTTEKGNEIIALAKEAIQISEKIHASLSGTDNNLDGVFKLAVIPTISPYLLPLFLPSFQKKHPHTKFEIQEMETLQIIEKLNNGALDLGILASPIQNEQVIEQSIYFEEFYVYLSPTSKLINKTNIKPEDLDLNNILLLEDGHCFKEQALSICPKSKADLNTSLKAGSIQTLIHMVDKGVGSTFIPQLCLGYLNKKQLKQVRKLSSRPYREISIIRSKYFYRRKLIDAMTDGIQASLPKEILTKRPKNTLGLDFD